MSNEIIDKKEEFELLCGPYEMSMIVEGEWDISRESPDVIEFDIAEGGLSIESFDGLAYTRDPGKIRRLAQWLNKVAGLIEKNGGENG